MPSAWAETDSVTLVDDRPWYLNVDEPYISVWCGRQKAKLITKDDTYRRYSCPHQAAPTGKLDMLAVLKHKDAHALGVCAARKYLYDHMEAEGRKAYAASFAGRGIH